VRTGANFKNNFGNGPRATPTVHDGAVYALGANGDLVAVQAADGAELWRHDLGEKYGAEPPRWGVSTSPLVEGDLLVVDVGGSGSVVAFDRKSGAEVWASQSEKAGYSAPLAIDAAGARQLLVFAGRALVSLNPANGERYWKLEWITSYDVNASTPIFLPPDRVFISTGYDKGAAMLKLVENGDGVRVEELWSNREMRNKFSSSVLWDGHLYGFDEATLKCLDPQTGSTLWRERGLGHGSLMIADGHLIVLSDKGKLVLAEATPKGYNEKATAQVFEGKTWTVPTLAGGRLYLRNEEELVALDVSGRR
jgi:outer membrane protein assembly factor BamB